MLIFSASLIILLNIFGLALTNPVQPASSSHGKTEGTAVDQAFRRAEGVLHRYYYLMDSDTDHLVHGMLHLLINHPTSFPFIPYRAMDIAFKNVAKKLGDTEVEPLSQFLLLSIEQHHQSKTKPASQVKLTAEMKEKIEDALDKFLDEEGFPDHL